jgi:hypothetical protein
MIFSVLDYKDLHYSVFPLLLYNGSRVFMVMSVSSNEKDLKENLVTHLLYVLI